MRLAKVFGALLLVCALPVWAAGTSVALYARVSTPGVCAVPYTVYALLWPGWVVAPRAMEATVRWSLALCD